MPGGGRGGTKVWGHGHDPVGHALSRPPPCHGGHLNNGTHTAGAAAPLKVHRLSAPPRPALPLRTHRQKSPNGADI